MEKSLGQKTVYIILYKLLQDFSIFFPFITEEIFQELYHTDKSIHITQIEPLNYVFYNEIELGNQMLEIISQARGKKTNSNVSLKTPIKKLSLGVSKNLNDALTKASKDFKATLFIENMETKIIDKDYEVYDIELDLEENKD